MIRWTPSTGPLGILLPMATIAQTSEEHPVYGPRLEGFGYRNPVAMRTVRSQGQELMKMAYMDVAPPARRTGGLSFYSKARTSAARPKTIRSLS